MGALPAAARAGIACAVPAAVACGAPAVCAGRHTPWATVALLAALCALGERLPRCSLTPPALLTGAFLLPPAAAALLAWPLALTARVTGPPRWARRSWRAAMYALATAAAARLCAPLRTARLPGALLPALAGALTLFLVVAVLDAAIRTAAEHRPVRAAWRGLPREVLVPALVYGPTALLTAVLWHSAYGPPGALLALPPVCVCSWFLDRCRRERAAHQAAIRALVQAVDLKDHYTRGHSERVGRASVLIARELGVAGERLEALRFAGTLHDVGKLGVPTRLLRKDGPLTPEERRVVQLHPQYGHEMVRGIGFLAEARAAILHHHERLDGSGYPLGLTDRQIPEAAKVVAVADAFDAMTSTRSYSRARPVPAALAELRRCAGSQFDPRMVDALSRALDRHGWHPEVPAEPGETAVPRRRNVPPDHLPDRLPEPLPEPEHRPAHPGGAV
ncbi:HD-GYP domain-containing protein [Streptomyces sp. NPDC052396]|uniref:HD-GYP domain-containing protein n=1 Tax=Streptomyces sp. NPDC052396 TaxID=3365689 RepID=UPI0037D8E925